MKIVFDTNILVRAHHRAQGPARHALMEGIISPNSVMLSQYLLQELSRVLMYPRLLKSTGLTSDDVVEYLEYLARAARFVTPIPVPAHLMNDATDEPILGTALAANADVICTLDTHFFDKRIISFANDTGIRILTDIDLIHILRGRH